jgi:hypothetical protein
MTDRWLPEGRSDEAQTATQAAAAGTVTPRLKASG